MKKLLSLTAALMLCFSMLSGIAFSEAKPTAAQPMVVQPMVVRVNGKNIPLATPPVIENGKLLVPIVSLCKPLGLELDFISTASAIFVRTKEDTGMLLKLKVGSSTAELNGKEVQLGCKVSASKGYTMVPLHFIADALKADLEWDKTTNTAILLTEPDRLVYFPDKALENIVRSDIKKYSGDIHKRDLKNVKRLFGNSAGIESLEGLQYACELRYLHFPYNNIRDLSPIGQLPNMVKLVMTRNKINDVTPLQNLTNLEFVFLNENQISDISAMRGLVNMTDLDLSYNPISSIESLGNMKKLNNLSLHNWSSMGDLSPLSKLSALKMLSVYVNTKWDLSFLESLPALQYLSIDGAPLNDLRPLKNIPALSSLDLKIASGCDLTPLKNYKTLTTLYICNSNLQDIKGLEELSSLNIKHLNLSSNKISDISPIKDFVNLEWLDISGNIIKDISTVSGLKKLSQFEAERNQIEDISPLRALTDICTLNLEQNKIRDISTLADFKKLSSLNISHNKIHDITPLSNDINLYWLLLNGNPVKDISILKNFTRLQYLQLGAIPAENVSVLDSLTSLKYLEAYGTDSIAKIKAINSSAKKLLDAVTKPSMTDSEKAAAIHDCLVLYTEPCEYDFGSFSWTDKYNNPYGMLCLDNEPNISYARTMELLLNMAGIEASTVCGRTNDKYYLWNSAIIDGKKLYIDIPMDISCSELRYNKISHRYFLLTEQQMADDHVWYSFTEN